MIEETKKILLEGNTVLSREFEYISVFNNKPVNKRAMMESHVISPELLERHLLVVFWLEMMNL